MPSVAERTLAGARVLRTIGPGTRCALVLGHVPRPDGEGDSIVLKVVHGDDAAIRAGREEAALDRAAGSHVVRLLDSSSDGATRVLLLEFHPGPTLDDLLERRASWAAGEVVTIIAPIAETLLRMHAAGVAHGAIAPPHVVFSANGAPMLVGFGAATVFPAGASEWELAHTAAVMADRDALRALALDLLDRVGGDRRGAARDFADALRRADAAEVLSLCAEGLFSVAAARPVAVDRITGAEVELAVWHDGGDSRERADELPGRERGVGAAWSLLTGVLPDRMREDLNHWLEVARDAVERLRDAVALRSRGDRTAGRELARSERPRLVLLGAVLAGVLSAAALVAVPPAASGEANAGTAGSTADVGAPRTGETASGRGERRDGEVADDQGEPIEPAPDLASRPDLSGALSASDDPVTAAAELLARRAECYRRLDEACIDAVVQASAPIAEQDQREIRAAIDRGLTTAEPPILPAAATVELVDLMGGVALLRGHAEGQAATILLIATSDGWKMRELIPVDPE